MPVAEADFSEQYLQWGAKNLPGGSFQWTDGSTSEVNLRVTAQHGTVKEAAWPYESFPWTEANDAACTGENKPTKCFTNGEPPASVATAEKFKLPSTRYINRHSIQAVIPAKKVGVNGGMDYVYQAGNDRKSTLPVDSDYWRKGCGTMPNAEDRPKSLQQRAGQAVHLNGWD